MPAPRPKLEEWPTRGGLDDSRGLRSDQGRIIERGYKEGLNPLCLRQGSLNAYEWLPGENDCALRHSPDVAPETQVGERVEPCGIDPRERRPATNRLDLLGRESELEQVAHGLLETREHEVSPTFGKSPHEELECRTSEIKAGGVVAGHHRKLIKVGDGAEGMRLGPERDWGLRRHGVALRSVHLGFCNKRR